MKSTPKKYEVFTRKYPFSAIKTWTHSTITSFSKRFYSKCLFHMQFIINYHFSFFVDPCLGVDIEAFCVINAEWSEHLGYEKLSPLWSLLDAEKKFWFHMKLFTTSFVEELQRKVLFIYFYDAATPPFPPSRRTEAQKTVCKDWVPIKSLLSRFYCASLAVVASLVCLKAIQDFVVLVSPTRDW